MALSLGLAVAASVTALLAYRVRKPISPAQILARIERNLVSIPAGTVTIGSREKGAAHPPREVTLPAFGLGCFEVTTDEFACYLTDIGATTTACLDVECHSGIWRPRRGRARWPVSHVSREDAERFCAWLSTKLGRRIRLPTETEWERAARGNIHGARFPWGWGDPKRRARYYAESPCRVGRYEPNAFGLYDVAGNVYEWCADELGKEYAVARGGSWAERDSAALRVFARAQLKPDYRNRDVGFRVLVESDEASREVVSK